jgi:hypothetical protein
MAFRWFYAMANSQKTSKEKRQMLKIVPGYRNFTHLVYYRAVFYPKDKPKSYAPIAGIAKT